MKAFYLQTEYMNNPMGIDMGSPRFFWNCTEGKKQSAYRIECRRKKEVVWDSGRVESAEMTHIAYNGKPLGSRDVIVWHVKLWDEQGTEGAWSDDAVFEMGLLKKDDWSAKWISGNYEPDHEKRYPVDYFRKNQKLTGKVEKARLYITACGLYEAYINEKRVGDFFLAPGSTDYRKRIQYQVYDVTELLQDQRQIALEVRLADGWYRGSVGAFGLLQAYGNETKLLFQLELRYEDGTTERMISNESVEWCNDGSLRFADLKDGELVEAARKPSYSGNAKVVSCGIVPSASNNVIPKRQEHFSARLLVTPSGTKVLDFGQNIAGIIQFKIWGEEGQKIKLRFGEILDKDGEFTQDNFQLNTVDSYVDGQEELLIINGQPEKIGKKLKKTPLQEITYYCKEGLNVYSTAFAVFGFRYVLVECDREVKPEDYEAVAVYSDMDVTGNFSCSNEKINRLYHNTLWSMKGNFLDVPTDCPTRERLGWTGDAQVFFNTGAYLMNVAAFYKKFLYDMLDSQTEQGTVPAVMPYSRADMMYNVSGASVGWADAVILIPYRYWKRYGDAQILKEFYPMMKKYADYMIKNTGHEDEKAAKEDPYNEFVYEKGFHLGEWLEPVEFQDTMIENGRFPLRTEECTAYLYYSMSCMAEIAEALGLVKDEALYKKYANGAALAYNRLFMNPCPDTDRQAKLVRPLALGIVAEEKRKACEERLVQAVKNRNYCIGTGFLSTPFVLDTLTKAGHADLAYKMLENETAPSWLSEINAGATTIWENWEGDASHNHYSPGAVCEWMFDSILGICVDGRRHFHIEPVPGGNLQYAEGSYESIYGKVESRWKAVEDGGYRYEIKIPANCSATIVIGGVTRDLEAGIYEF